MGKVLIVAEQRNGRLKKASLEMISASAAAGNETHAVLMGESVANLTAELGQAGAQKIHLIQDPCLKFYSAEAFTMGVMAVVKAQSPDVLIAAHTPTGRDLMPHVAAQLGVGMASDCTSLTFQGTNVVARRPVYSGKATAEVEFVGAGVKVLTVRPNALGAPKMDASKSGETLSVSVSFGTLKTKVLEVTQGAVGRPDVTEASIVISGGRAMKNAENFKLLEDTADIIGAAVGASRAAVDSGFRPHRDQVGQTGKTVSPQLYVACGISGAIQHLAGMRTSKVIVAINSDAQAPIFQVADYGVVNDLFTVVPVLQKEFKKLKEGS